MWFVCIYTTKHGGQSRRIVIGFAKQRNQSGIQYWFTLTKHIPANTGSSNGLLPKVGGPLFKPVVVCCLRTSQVNNLFEFKLVSVITKASENQIDPELIRRYLHVIGSYPVLARCAMYFADTNPIVYLIWAYLTFIFVINTSGIILIFNQRFRNRIIICGLALPGMGIHIEFISYIRF